ncbi:unnamed protein product [Rotaria magnacalcarata]|uniref:Inositol polyphosphate-related phosphatase domain-containing protein n=1 Tax=Rotaria magnacalcarata TaxID=392030 RepID=A0A819AUW0_9BILA|nr:unnamed protein product [Rotaria magnacalcarata]
MTKSIRQCFRCEDYERINLVYVLVDTDASRKNSAESDTQCLKDFFEAPITFPPTYKYVLNSDVYQIEKNEEVRRPSYTDHILISTFSNDLEIIQYSSIDDVKLSDHRPVFADTILHQRSKNNDMFKNTSTEKTRTTNNHIKTIVKQHLLTFLMTIATITFVCILSFLVRCQILIKRQTQKTDMQQTAQINIVGTPSSVESQFIHKIIKTRLRNNSINGIHIQIYDNIAEVSQSITPYDLPVTFSQQEWYDIRADSIRLVGNCVNVRAQILSFNRTSLNGQRVMIKRDIDSDLYTDGIMIDETRNLVEDLIDNTYYTITNDRIRYLSIPSVGKFSVDFVLETCTNEQVYLRYLQNKIKWKVRYDLLLASNNTDSILQAYAEIRNDGGSSLVVNSAKLFSGDINIQSTSGSVDSNAYGGGASDAPLFQSQSNGYASAPSYPAVSDAEELVGLYIFSINETFILDTRSSYTLPMFRPIIDIERYGSIEKSFLPTDNRGNVQRTYRLRVEQTFLPRGQVFIRESDQLVGEIYWPDLASNETNEFTLGQDPDLRYIERVQLNSRRKLYQTNSSRIVLSTYTIDLHLINNKPRAMNIEYRLKFSSQSNLKLSENTTNNALQLDGSSIIGTFELNANDEQQYKFTFETE